MHVQCSLNQNTTQIKSNHKILSSTQNNINMFILPHAVLAVIYHHQLKSINNFNSCLCALKFKD